MAMRHRCGEPLATRAAGIAASHVGGEAAFIEEHQAGGVQPGLSGTPGEAGGRNVGPVLLRRRL